MFSNPFNFVLVMALLALWQPQAGNTQFLPPYNGPAGGSLSKASSTGSERQLQLGKVGLSRADVKSQTVTRNNGGTISTADSRSRTRGLNLGGLQVGSTLTASKTKTNDAVSRGLSHNLNVGKFGVGSSLSRDNLRHGFGLQQSPAGGLKLGLGLLNIDLSRNQNQQALTNAQAQAQGKNAFAKSKTNADTVTRNFGRLGITKTESQSKAISGTRYGQSSAQAGGLAGSGGRPRRYAEYTNLGNYIRSKRRAEFINVAYPASELHLPRRQFGFQNFDYRQTNYGVRNSNAPGLTNRNNDKFQQQAGANTHSSQELNEIYVFQNNGDCSMGANLAADGNSGQLSFANANQGHAPTTSGSPNLNNAQSQDLKFDENAQQTVNANAGTKQLETEGVKRTEAHNGALANEEVAIHSHQDDTSRQSIFQHNNAKTSASVNAVQEPAGSVSNSATSHVAADRRGGQSANSVASSSDFDDSNNDLSNAGSFGDFYDFGGAFGNMKRARSFANRRTGYRG